MEALRAQKVRQAAERLAAGPAYVVTGYVFTDELGQPLHPRNITAAFARVAKRLGLSTRRLHALRHTLASLMISAGVDVRAVSAVLGHANASITMNVYRHLFEGSQANAVTARRPGAAARAHGLISGPTATGLQHGRHLRTLVLLEKPRGYRVSPWPYLTGMTGARTRTPLRAADFRTTSAFAATADPHERRRMFVVRTVP